MLHEHTNFQCQNEFYLKISNLRNINSFTIEKGVFYLCISGVHLLERFIGGVRKKNYWNFPCFHCEIDFPKDLEHAQIDRKTDVFLASYKMMRHVKVEKMLKNNGLSEAQIKSFFEEFHLNSNDYADRIHVLVKAAILVEILFEKNDLILFHPAGLTFYSSMKIYERIRQRLQQYPQKSAIVFDIADGYDEVFLKDISKQEFDEYGVWLKEKIYFLRSEESLRQEEEFRKDLKERLYENKAGKSNWKN